jgi:Ca-activated chloride channel family protein
MKRRPAIQMIGILGVASFLSGVVPAIGMLAHGAADDFTIRNVVRLVLLDVSVQSRDGNFVPGLSKQDFTISENGQPQTISVFDSEDAPVTMGIVIDESGSMTPKRHQVLAAAENLISESNPADEVFVLNFNDTVKRGLPPNVLFSSKIPQLRDALYRERPTGQTALYDAVADGLKQLEDGTRGRKTLIVVSDGRDNVSLHKRDQTIELVERSAATIFTIGLFDADQYDADPGILRQFAKISGGEALFPMNLADVSGACHRIAKEIRARYTIGYIPREAKDANAAPLRHLQVKVSAAGRNGLTVLTRTSYIYDEPKTK